MLSVLAESLTIIASLYSVFNVLRANNHNKESNHQQALKSLNLAYGFLTLAFIGSQVLLLVKIFST